MPIKRSKTLVSSSPTPLAFCPRPVTRNTCAGENARCQTGTELSGLTLPAAHAHEACGSPQRTSRLIFDEVSKRRQRPAGGWYMAWTIWICSNFTIEPAHPPRVRRHRSLDNLLTLLAPAAHSTSALPARMGLKLLRLLETGSLDSSIRLSPPPTVMLLR